MQYKCVVCGYDGLDFPQYLEHGEPNFSICPCCGWESGFDDLDRGLTFEEYRKGWIKEGAEWLNIDKKPDNWDLKRQLARINVSYD